MSRETEERRYGLLEAVGVEIELCVVNAQTLDVSPVAELALHDERGEVQSEIEHGEYAWSNELVSHVLELKTNGPVRSLDGARAGFAEQVAAVNRLLSVQGARLMPTAMHPWMDPRRQTQLWPHEGREIYEAFDRHFDCRRHGWANLQSVHVNLPFQSDEDFARLHAAVRLLLPLLPALAASSPIVDGVLGGYADTRLAVYRDNAARFPAITGSLVPEAVFGEQEYRSVVFGPIEDAIAELGEQGRLEAQWVNARGAIARFDRGSVEIRVIDTQESATMCLAIVAFTVAMVRALVEERWSSTRDQRALGVAELDGLLRATTRSAEAAVIDSEQLLAALGRPARPCTAGELLTALQATLFADLASFSTELGILTTAGSLSTRILRALGANSSSAVQSEALRTVYAELCSCLAEDRPFRPQSGS